MAGSRNVASGVLTTLIRRNYSPLALISSRKSRVSMECIVMLLIFELTTPAPLTCSVTELVCNYAVLHFGSDGTRVVADVMEIKIYPTPNKAMLH